MALIPADNNVAWEPGVRTGMVGGIPTDLTQYVNAVSGGVDNTGSIDVTAALQALLDACPANQYVYLPDGTYRVDGVLSWNSTNQGVTLRGADAVPIIEFGSTGCIVVSSGDTVGIPFGNTLGGTTVSSGLTKGSTQITIPDGSGFSVGRIMRILVKDYITLPVFSPAGYEDQSGQVVRITGRTGGTIDFWPPLLAAYGAWSAQVRVDTTQNGFFLSGVGIENLHLNGNGAQGCIALTTVSDCWLKNVKIQGIVNYPISFQTGTLCEIRKCYVDDLMGGGSNRSGILMNALCSSLIEDNIIGECQPAVEVNQLSSGNVISYNYASPSNVFGFDTNHAAHPAFNLWEGNYASNLISDGYFGSASHDTVFRCCFTGTVSLKRFTRNYAFVGCRFPTSIQFGYPNIGNTGSSGTADYPSDPWADYGITGEVTGRDSDAVATITVSSVGQMTVGFQGFYTVWNGLRRVSEVTAIDGLQVTLGNWSGVAPGDAFPIVGTEVSVFTGAGGYQELDLGVQASTTLKGNYYADTEETESLGGDTMVDSLIHPSKPSWFGDLPWPFDPVAADPESIPAGYRFVNGEEPEPGGDGAITATTLNITTLNVG